MTEQQIQTIEAAIDAALTALPDGDDQQLKDWIAANVTLPPDVHEALLYEGLKETIRERAHELRITLQE